VIVDLATRALCAVLLSLVAANDYVFVTLCRVPGNVDRAYRILVDIENYPRWWPKVYLRVEPLTPLKKPLATRCAW
jgi:hypothetical protein